MRPYHFYHHPPDGFGVWHGGWLGLASLALPLLLFALPLLALLLWLAWRSFGVRRGGWLPATSAAAPASAVETLRQRYARGEIDENTFGAMLDRLNSSGHEQLNQDYVEDSYRETRHEEVFRPRPDLPIDWS